MSLLCNETKREKSIHESFNNNFPCLQYIILLCPSALKGFKIILKSHALAHISPITWVLMIKSPPHILKKVHAMPYSKISKYIIQVYQVHFLHWTNNIHKSGEEWEESLILLGRVERTEGGKVEKEEGKRERRKRRAFCNVEKKRLYAYYFAIIIIILRSVGFASHSLVHVVRQQPCRKWIYFVILSCLLQIVLLYLSVHTVYF